MDIKIGDYFNYHGIPLMVLKIKNNFAMLENGEDVTLQDLVECERIYNGSKSKSDAQ